MAAAVSEELAEEYEVTLRSVISAAYMLAMYDLPKILQAIDLADTLGPFRDPTLWAEKGEAMRQDADLLRAALPLWRFGKQIRADRLRTQERS